jgi:hypothetical protein
MARKAPASGELRAGIDFGSGRLLAVERCAAALLLGLPRAFEAEMGAVGVIIRLGPFCPASFAAPVVAVQPSLAGAGKKIAHLRYPNFGGANSAASGYGKRMFRSVVPAPPGQV